MGQLEHYIRCAVIGQGTTKYKGAYSQWEPVLRAGHNSYVRLGGTRLMPSKDARALQRASYSRGNLTVINPARRRSKAVLAFSRTQPRTYPVRRTSPGLTLQYVSYLWGHPYICKFCFFLRQFAVFGCFHWIRRGPKPYLKMSQKHLSNTFFRKEIISFSLY